jgi:hypothetical protein
VVEAEALWCRVHKIMQAVDRVHKSSINSAQSMTRFPAFHFRYPSQNHVGYRDSARESHFDGLCLSPSLCHNEA